MLKFNDIAADVSANPTLPPDLYADFVIHFKYDSKKSSTHSIHSTLSIFIQYKSLINALYNSGLQHETRVTSNGSILIFILCPLHTLSTLVHQARVNDYLYGVRILDINSTITSPTHAISDTPVTPAERLRLVHDLLTTPIIDGGLGITPKIGIWSNVDSILALHDRNFNQIWLRKWATTWLISDNQLTHIRNHFGEKVAFYFAFVQFYSIYLAAPTIFGFFCHFFLSSSFSRLFSTIIVIWSIIFLEAWKRRQLQLATLWGVRNVHYAIKRRSAFKPDSFRPDPITGKNVPYFPFWKRYLRLAEGIPVIIIGFLITTLSISLVFAIEIFISELYLGPFKEILVYLPTILFTTFIPTIAGIYIKIAKNLTDRENHETDASHEFSLTQKIFVLSFVTSFMSLTLVAFIYVPFGEIIIPRIFSLIPGQQKFHIDVTRLHRQYFCEVVTSQFINFVMEVIVPYIMRTGAQKVEKLQQRHNNNNGEIIKNEILNKEEEKEFIERVKIELNLPEYDLYVDYAEMAKQFGNVILYGTIWPLAPLAAFINNWIELRSDAAKICINTRRPIPERVDSIGAWLENFQTLAWVSSLTNAALIGLYSPALKNIRSLYSIGFLTLFLMLFSEHIYMLLRGIIGTIIRHIPSWANEIVLREQWEIRKKLLNSRKDLPVVMFERDIQKGEYWNSQTESQDEGWMEIKKTLGAE